MGNSLRCCIACVLPCGALDLIRIVHLNGLVEEITHPITAGEILKANPNHVLSKPCSEGLSHRILIYSPDSDLKRGSIYFLIPTSSLHQKKNNITTTKVNKSSRKKNKQGSSVTEKEVDKRQHVVRGKLSTKKDRRVFMPYLQSISED